MSKAKRVMLVEDDAILSFVGEKLITRLGYKVVGKASSGEEALKIMDDCNPDIIVMDIQLAGSIDGIQTIQELRNRHIETPVIFLSGDSDYDLLKRAKRVDCVDYLIKPVSASSLLNPLNEAADRVNHSNHAA